MLAQLLLHGLVHADVHGGLGDVGVDEAGADRRDADVLPAQLGAQALGEHQHGGLGGGVRGVDARGGVGRGRGDVDDLAALAALHHLGREQPRTVDYAPQVDADDLLPVGGTGTEEPTTHADAGVVHDDVRHPVLGAHLGREGVPALGVGDVEVVRVGLGADGVDEPDGLRRGRVVDVGDDDVRTLAGELQRGGAPDAASPAGDHDELAGERAGPLSRGGQRLLDELGGATGDHVGTITDHPVPAADAAGAQVRRVRRRGLRLHGGADVDVPARGDYLDGELRGPGAWAAQVRPHVRPVQLQTVDLVGLAALWWGIDGGRAASPLTGEVHQLVQHPAAPRRLGQPGQLEEGDVVRVEQLAHGRARMPITGAHPGADVVQRGAGDRGERRESRREAFVGDGGPALDRAPVVGEEMHRRIRAHRIEHGAEVVDELSHAVGLAVARLVRCAGAADVVGDHAVALGQDRHDPVPYVVVVRVAVHRDHRGGFRVTGFVDGQAHAVGRGHLSR